MRQCRIFEGLVTLSRQPRRSTSNASAKCSVSRAVLTYRDQLLKGAFQILVEPRWMIAVARVKNQNERTSIRRYTVTGCLTRGPFACSVGTPGRRCRVELARGAVEMRVGIPKS